MEKFDKDSISVARSHLNMNLHLSKNIGENVSQLEYACIIGSLVYIMNCTRSYIASSISRLSRYTSNLGVGFWKVIV